MQQHKHHGQILQHTISWSKPQPSYLKCNVDCALFNNNSVAGYGFCFRNSADHFVFGMPNFSHCTLLPAEAEAWGLFEAMKFALANDMFSVTF